jgi:hypothetical protein
MFESRPLEVVFLTNFNDYCYRSIPALAQLADDFAMRLTIAYSSNCNPRSIDDMKKLEAFFPEADSYARCRRLLMTGDLVDAVNRLAITQPVDLLIAPAADPLGFPRIGHRSLRAKLLREARIPLWSIGRRTKPAKLRSTPRHVGCWVDFHRGWTSPIGFAREYARATGADLHILHALPEIHEGRLAPDEQPLFEDSVVEAVTKAIGPSPVPMHFHIAESDRKSSRTKLIETSGADIVFVADLKPLLPDWIAPKPRLLDECVCPVVHVPVDTEVPVWRLMQDTYIPASLEHRLASSGRR